MTSLLEVVRAEIAAHESQLSKLREIERLATELQTHAPTPREPSAREHEATRARTVKPQRPKPSAPQNFRRNLGRDLSSSGSAASRKSPRSRRGGRTPSEEVEAAVLRAVTEAGVTSRQIRDDTGLAASSIHLHLTRLAERGDVVAAPNVNGGRGRIFTRPPAQPAVAEASTTRANGATATAPRRRSALICDECGTQLREPSASGLCGFCAHEQEGLTE